MVDLTPIFNAIIALVAALITAFVIPWIKTKIKAEKLEQIKQWVTIAVQAAEQIYIGSGRGEEKKQYVLDFLNAKGYTIEFDNIDIDALIEAIVFELPQEIKLE